MMNAVGWWRAALLVAALGIAGQAHAASSSGPGSTGASSTGTGIPQSAEPAFGNSGDSAESRTVNPQASAGVPEWYAVNVGSGAQPVRQPTVVMRQLDVPRWYAVS
jgi:hypothetical protein